MNAGAVSPNVRRLFNVVACSDVMITQPLLQRGSAHFIFCEDKKLNDFYSVNNINNNVLATT